MSSESQVTIINKILGKEYQTSGSASATASGENSQEIADNISKFIATKQAEAVGQTMVGQSKSGFFPLYLSEELAIQNSNTNTPSVHSHNINGTIWFMPNKINNIGLFHGDNSENLNPFIVPNSPRLLSQMLMESNELSTLKNILEQLELLEFFQNTFEPIENPTKMNKYTVLAPINSAFEEIEPITSTLLSEQLNDILLSHIIENSVFSSQLENGQKVKTLGTLELEVLIESGKVYFKAPGSTGEVIFADIPGTNGLVHILDKVLLPGDIVTPEPEHPYSGETLYFQFSGGHPAAANFYLRLNIPVNLNNQEDGRLALFPEKPKALDSAGLLESGTIKWAYGDADIRSVYNEEEIESIFRPFFEDGEEISNLDGWYTFSPTNPSFPTNYIFAINPDLLIGYEGILLGQIRELKNLSFDGWLGDSNSLVRSNDYTIEILKLETGVASEGVFVKNGILYYTILDDGIYSLNLNLESEPVLITKGTFNGLLEYTDDEFLAANYSLTGNFTQPAGISLVSFNGSITEFYKDNNPDTPINDICWGPGNKEILFATAIAANTIYCLRVNNKSSTLIDEFKFNGGYRPNGIVYYDNKLYVTANERAEILMIDIIENNGDIIFGEDATLFCNLPKIVQIPKNNEPLGAGKGDGLEIIKNLTINNVNYGDVLIVATNNSALGVQLFILNTGESLFFDIPTSATNLTYYDSTIIVTTFGGIYRISLELALQRPLVMNPGTTKNVLEGWKVSIFAHGLPQLRSLITNQQDDVIALVENNGVVLFRSNDNNLPLLPENGVLLIDDLQYIVDTNTTETLNHGLASRYIDGQLYIFATTQNEFRAYPYDDSTPELALQPCGSPIIIVNNLSAGSITTIEREGNFHQTREICFDKNDEPDVFIQCASPGNVDASDDWAVIRKLSYNQLLNKLRNPDIEPYDYPTLPLRAQGLRNVVGMALDVNGELTATNTGMDELPQPDNVEDPALGPNDIFTDYHPGDQYYDLREDRVSLKYGYPYSWINGRELIEDGVTIPKNNNFLERRLLGEATKGERENPYTTEQIRDSATFVQGSDLLFPAHCTPIQLRHYYNDPNNNGYLCYDGKTDKRIKKSITTIENSTLVTWKGSWNRTESSGNRLVSFDENRGTIKDALFNDTFKSGFVVGTGIGKAGDYTFRPTGLTMNKKGHILISTDPSIGPQQGAIYLIRPE